jgi:mono/diheme cytochrome c family protein
VILAALWKNDVRHYIILLNIITFGALIIYLLYAVLSPKKAASEERLPANLEPYLPDEDLEGRRLERVQAWALMFAAIIAIALPIYWLREPTRQNQSAKYFTQNSIARGATLFARPGTPEYNAASSLQCANCHGDKGEGGVASTTINGVKVAWKAPPLNTEGLRFQEDPACLNQAAREEASPPAICDITDIITYGRPGTPMQAWGVEGGGPKNDQSIADLVAYIESIQISPAQSQKQNADALADAKMTPEEAEKSSASCPEYAVCPGIQIAEAQSTLKTDQAAFETAKTATAKTLNMPDASAADLTKACTTLETTVGNNPNALTPDEKTQAISCGKFLAAQTKVSNDQSALAWAQELNARRANVSDGQILFEVNCARCHTQGWSVFDPTQYDQTQPNSLASVGLVGGGGGQGGGIGFNLRDGDVQRRFGDDASGGWAAQYSFVALGSQPFKPYGNLGIGSGRMPGFAQVPSKMYPYVGAMLSQDQLSAIVSFERDCLETIDYQKVSPVCETPTVAPTTTSTTTTTAPKG